MTVSNIVLAVARRATPVVVGGWLAFTMAVPAHAASPWQTWRMVSVAGQGDVRVAAAAQKRGKAKTRKVKSVTPPERTPSGETVTDRERRLMRECKGRPNAGACLGFAS